MTPQTLHDFWLIVTVVATLEISAVSIYLWRMFRSSSRRWFFWTISIMLASIALEHVASEIKNLGQPAPHDFNIAAMWLVGRIQEAVVAGIVLGYMVFGQNGSQPTVPPPAPTEN